MKIRTYILVILFYSLLVGAIAIIVLPEFGGSDASTYDGIAMNIVNQGKFIEIHEQITPPLYPVFLSIIYGIFGHNYTAVYVIQFILLFIISLIIFRIGIEFLNLKKYQAFIASIIIISWPYMILFAKQRLTEILYITWLSVFIYLALKFFTKPNLKLGIILGIVLALAAHTRPVIIFLPLWLLFFYSAYLLFKKIKLTITDKDKKILKYSLTAILVFVLLIIPYSIYGTKKIGRLSLVASNASDMYKRANISMVREWQIYKTPGYEPGAELNTRKLLLIKLKNIYRFWDSGADGKRALLIQEKFPIAKYFINLYNIGFYLIVILAFLSLLILKRNKYLIVLWLIIFYFWSIHIIIYPYPRYTLPIMPLMILFAILSLFYLYKNKIKIRFNKTKNE